MDKWITGKEKRRDGGKEEGKDEERKKRREREREGLGKSLNEFISLT